MPVPDSPTRAAGGPVRTPSATAAGAYALTHGEFSERFTAAGRMLWALAAGVLGRPDECEDVLQEAAMIAWQRIGQFDPTTSFPAWAGRIVRFVALNKARLRQRRQTEATDPVVLDQAVAVPGCAAEPGDFDTALQQVDDELFRALATLRAQPRACLLLRVLGGMDYGAIAEVLGIPASTAMSHVHRARAALQRELGGGGEAR